MKLILISVTILIVSCSPAKVVVSQPEPVAIIKEPTELEILNDKMLHSQSYVTFNKHGEDFLEKLNYQGSPAIIADYKKLLAWIKDNIKTTAFTSYEEAEAEFYKLAKESDVVWTENATFYELFLKASPDEAADLSTD